jgi:hypothetical protein
LAGSPPGVDRRTVDAPDLTTQESQQFEKLINAPLQLTVAARVRVLRAADGAVLYETAFDRLAGLQTFTD